MQPENRLRNVVVGDHVEIITSNKKLSKGYVKLIAKSAKSDNVNVILHNGRIGKVIHIIPRGDEPKKQILKETQYNENKENFCEGVMRANVIPKTVQSFLNSEGGYLNIGIKDSGTVAERFVGIEKDLKYIGRNLKNPTNGKLCDKYEQSIMDSLDKYLESDTAIGPLLEITFERICDVQIARIRISPSPKPWFFRQYGNKLFDVMDKGKVVERRKIDNFYVRSGPGKKPLETMSEFYKYAKDHWNFTEMVERHG